MLLSAVSVLVVVQSSSEIPEGLMNNPVFLISIQLNSKISLGHVLDRYSYRMKLKSYSNAKYPVLGEQSSFTYYLMHISSYDSNFTSPVPPFQSQVFLYIRLFLRSIQIPFVPMLIVCLAWKASEN